LENARLKLDNADRDGLLQKGKIYALASLQKITHLNAEQTLQILRSWNEENTAIVYFEIKHNRDAEPWFAVLNNDKKLWANKAKALLTEIRRMFPNNIFKRKDIRNFITKHGMDLNNFINAMTQEGLIINTGYGLYEIIPIAPTPSENNNLNENRS
jgi:ERCC4-type nuclease